MIECDGCGKTFDGTREGVVEADTGAEGSEDWALCPDCADDSE